MKSRSIAKLALGLLLACGVGMPTASAQSYPEKPITLIIPLGAGGSHDLNARVFTSVIPTYLGQPIIVKLMPGAGGQIGTSAAAKAEPDGYTLLFSHNYIDQLQQFVQKLPYDPTKDLVTIARLNYAPGAIVVRADAPWKTLPEMLDYGRKNPGKLKFAHSGNWGCGNGPGCPASRRSRRRRHVHRAQGWRSGDAGGARGRRRLHHRVPVGHRLAG